MKHGAQLSDIISTYLNVLSRLKLIFCIIIFKLPSNNLNVSKYIHTIGYEVNKQSGFVLRTNQSSHSSKGPLRTKSKYITICKKENFQLPFFNNWK
ncbi:hypothetical protein encoded by prophage [Escherichia coli]|nr:hypothetical protein encoded by prophage [Escherichia coli]